MLIKRTFDFKTKYKTTLCKQNVNKNNNNEKKKLLTLELLLHFKDQNNIPKFKLSPNVGRDKNKRQRK